MFGRLILHVIAVKNISSPKGFFFCKCQWKKNKGDEEFSEEKNSVTPLCLYLWALWLYYFDPQFSKIDKEASFCLRNKNQNVWQWNKIEF